MDFEAVIGLEIHIQMNTRSKIFSSAPVTFGKEPNTQVALFDMAFPGVMPVVNKQAVVNAIRVCNALGMRIDDMVVFDRKNYFYSDLPKGYQITQEFRPIGRDGVLDIGDRKIGIERLHIEEDTCKQFHYGDFTLLDYNRAGIPLLEIVSKPEIRNGKEAGKFVQKIQSIVTFLDVSDGKMENGSLRCDVNVSLKDKNSNSLGTKVEIKNLNSVSNIQKAIDFEIARQADLIEKGMQIEQETRRFDENSRKTVLMRIKTDAIDYKCFTEPNIAPIHLSKEFIEDAINTSPELAEAKLQRYIVMGLSSYDANLLVSNRNTSKYFDEGIKLGVNPKLFANWIIGDIQSVLNKEEIDISEFNISPALIVELIGLVESNKISNTQAREIFAKMLFGPISPKQLLEKEDISLITSEDELNQVIINVLSSNPQSIQDYINGKDKVVGYLVGQVMKQTKGKADPALANKLVLNELKRR